MTQTSTTVVAKSASDLLTAAEVNNMNTVINANSTDSESRIAALEVSTHNALVTKQVVVNEAADLSGTLDSTVVYIINGIIDMGNQSIEVPAGGLNLTGLTFDVSKLISSSPSYTMFTSPVGGSGNILGRDYAIEVTGAGSQVYDLEDATGFSAFEFARINYNNCSSLGTLDGYRQGFETGTGRFGGSPTLTLAGTWVGGYFIDSSIVRSLDAGMTDPLFKAGAGFSMASRFRSNQNIDLPVNVAFFDFNPSHFPNPNTVQLSEVIISRNGVFDPTDSNITPNLSRADVQAQYKGCVGMQNTYVGGKSIISSASTTGISSGSTFYDLNGTWSTLGLQHFDAPAAGQLRHTGVNPIEFNLTADLLLESNPNDVLEIRFKKWDDSAGSFLYFGNQRRQVNSLVGGRDVAFFTVLSGIKLEQNDYIMLQVANNNGNNDVTAEVDSFFRVQER